MSHSEGPLKDTSFSKRHFLKNGFFNFAISILTANIELSNLIAVKFKFKMLEIIQIHNIYLI